MGNPVVAKIGTTASSMTMNPTVMQIGRYEIHAMYRHPLDGELGYAMSQEQANHFYVYRKGQDSSRRLAGEFATMIGAIRYASDKAYFEPSVDHTFSLEETGDAGYASEIRIQDVCLPDFYQGTPHYYLLAPVTAESHLSPQAVLEELRDVYLILDPDSMPTIRENLWQDLYEQLQEHLPGAVRNIEPVPEDEEPGESVYLYVEVVPEQKE